MKLKSKIIFSLCLVFLLSKHGYAEKGENLEIYIFFSENCPICKSATLNLKELFSTFDSKGVKFTAVFPNTNLSDKNSIEKFRKKYNLPFEHKLDTNQELTKKYNATITPEVILVNNRTDEVLYRGKIDNGFEAVGKKRTVITEFYLRDALQSSLENKTIEIKETRPVGCFIIKQNL